MEKWIKVKLLGDELYIYATKIGKHPTKEGVYLFKTRNGGICGCTYNEKTEEYIMEHIYV